MDWSTLVSALPSGGSELPRLAPSFLATVASPTSLFQAMIQAIILGIVQGITEFLPISSTAHLLIFTDLLGWQQTWNKAAIDAIQFGSVIAVVSYFRHDLRDIATGAWAAWKTQDWDQESWKIFVGIAIGTVPALAGGLALKLLDIEIGSTVVIAVMSIVMAILLGLAEQYGRRKRDFSQLKTTDGIWVGLGQMLALLPGVSRSGSTLTTALFLGLERDTAARFSFLLGIPTLTIATLVQAKDVIDQGDMWLPLLLGIISTTVFSYLSIAWLLKFLRQRSTWVFVWYRLGLGAVLLTTLAGGLLRA